jgi:LEA14-like dessication related protein
MEKLLKKITITLFTFCIIISFASCKSLPAAPEMPVISLSSAELTNITFNGVQLLCKVQIENPNSFEIPFPKINWRIFLDNNSFINGVIENNQRIGAGETTIIEVPIHLEYLEIFTTFSSLRGRSKADYKIALALNFPIPVIQNRTWTLEHEGELPLLQAPRFSSPIMRVVKTDSIMVELYVSVNVDNPNVFELPTPRLNFDYQVNDTSILRHRLNSRGPLASSSVTPVVFGLLVYYADLFRILPTVQTAYEVQGLLDLTIDFPVPAFSGENFNLKIPGTLPLTGR